MQVLVTGGGGFLGLELVSQLNKEGYRLRSFSRNVNQQLTKFSVEIHRGDLNDQSAVHKAVSGCDVVFHVAAKAGVWGELNSYYQTNVIGTRNIVEACLQHKIRYLIYTSSPSVTFSGQDQQMVNEESCHYPTKFYCHYQETKKIAEQYVLQDRTPRLYSVALRPHLIWGKNDPHLIPRLLARAHRFRFIGNGENLIDTTYIDNAAYAHLCALKALQKKPNLSGRSYFITNDEPVSMRFFVNSILASYGYPPVNKKIPRSLAFIIADSCEYLYRLARISNEPPLTSFTARQLASSHCYSIKRACRELNYHPQISLKQGLARLNDR